MTRKINRREFLRAAALTTAAAAVAACAQPAPTATPVPAKPAAQPTAAPAATAVPIPTKAPVPAGPKAGGIFNYAEAGDFNSFNPWRFEAVNVNMYNMAFDRLIWKDANGKEQFQLATSWEMAKDGLSAKVKVREDAKWHDGQPIVAEDFVKMYNWTQDKALQDAEASIRKMRDLFKPIKGVKALDKFTLEFAFAAPLPYFTDILDYFWALRIDDPADPALIKKMPVGSGPFKLVEWVPQQYAKLARFDGYHTKGKPYFDTVMFKRLAAAETLIPNLQSGAVDGIFVTSPADVAQLQADKNLNVLLTPHPGSMFPVMVNVRKPPFDKKEVRQAFSYALNRTEIAKTAFFGISKPICAPFGDPSSLAYRADLDTYYKFDLDKAAKLFEAAGIKNYETNIQVTPRWPQMKLFCLIWQADLAKIGVKMTVTEVEQAKFLETGNDANLKGQDMHPWVVGRSTRDPAVFFGTQITHRGGETAKHGFKNEELEKLIAEGAVELDTEKRKKIYQRCSEILVEEVPMIHVATDPRIWSFNKKVQGAVAELTGNLMVTDASFT